MNPFIYSYTFCGKGLKQKNLLLRLSYNFYISRIITILIMNIHHQKCHQRSWIEFYIPFKCQSSKYKLSKIYKQSMHKKEGTPLTPRSQNTTSANSSQDKVKVLLRVRPFLSSEEPQEFFSLVDDNVIQIRKLGMTSMMKFNYVQVEAEQKYNAQKSQANQLKMYAHVQQTIQDLFSGIDGTVFAYGQTGAGKTYTIVGNCPEAPESGLEFRPYLIDEKRGIMVRAMEEIITISRKRKDSRITISFFQIYNEKIFDLLTNNPKPLDIREGKNGEISIPGLIKIQIIDIKEALNCIGEGLKNRVTSSTAGNIKSSRSHSIFQIKCERLKIDPNTNQHKIVVSNLRIVDLAGSQKFNIPRDLPAYERQIRLTQLKCINGSLSKLGHCISALTKQNRTHIPFRDSKLTRILRQSLLGPSKIKLIVCVSPSISAMNQTTSTLQFADSVKKAIFGRPVSPTPEKKKMIEESQYQAVLLELQNQRAARLQAERIIQTLQSNSSQIELIRENDKLRQQVTQLKEELKVYRNKVKIAGLSVSRSKVAKQSKSPQNRHHPPKSITGAKKLNGTPPKTASSRSVIQFDHRNSVDSNFDRESSHRQSSQYRETPGKKLMSREPKLQIPITHLPVNKKQSFENKIRRFMERNDDNDRELQEKVKQRLRQIRTEIVQSRDWGAPNNFIEPLRGGNLQDNEEVEKLWQKPQQ